MAKTVKTKSAPKAKVQKPVLVTTEFRGVFFGFLKSQKGRDELTLTRAKNCIYWSQDVKGFLGLAKIGPSSSCKIGAEVKELTVYKITSITPVEEDAVKKWENA